VIKVPAGIISQSFFVQMLRHFKSKLRVLHNFMPNNYHSLETIILMLSDGMGLI